jgi:hypothetical protein
MKLSLEGTAAFTFKASLFLAVLQSSAQARPFVLDEASVESVHAAFANNTLTCSALIEGCLARIERNRTLSNGTGFPAVTFPGGFSSPSASAPLGVPVGAELLGRDYSEPLLLSLANSFAPSPNN